jgi:Co/Zn/Cd efflux system component
MLESLLGFIIFIIIVIVVAAIVIWAVQRFFPEVYTPARLRLFQAGVPGMP